jgi:hypothetical protein
MQSVNRGGHLQKRELLFYREEYSFSTGGGRRLPFAKIQPEWGSSAVKSTLLNLENTLLCRMRGLSPIPFI